MWTTDNRGRYDRGGLRYPSDLTDEEWKLVEPLIPPGKRGGDKRTVNLREVLNGLMYVCRRAASGARSRRIYLRARRCMAISISGTGTPRSTASITNST